MKVLSWNINGYRRSCKVCDVKSSKFDKYIEKILKENNIIFLHEVSPLILKILKNKNTHNIYYAMNNTRSNFRTVALIDKKLTKYTVETNYKYNRNILVNFQNGIKIFAIHQKLDNLEHYMSVETILDDEECIICGDLNVEFPLQRNSWKYPKSSEALMYNLLITNKKKKNALKKQANKSTYKENKCIDNILYSDKFEVTDVVIGEEWKEKLSDHNSITFQVIVK